MHCHRGRAVGFLSRVPFPRVNASEGVGVSKAWAPFPELGAKSGVSNTSKTDNRPPSHPSIKHHIIHF